MATSININTWAMDASDLQQGMPETSGIGRFFTFLVGFYRNKKRVL